METQSLRITPNKTKCQFEGRRYFGMGIANVSNNEYYACFFLSHKELSSLVHLLLAFLIQLSSIGHTCSITVSLLFLVAQDD
jgi:MFS-type transporter involved in bile tolerance (Atg22 family)